MGPPESLVVAAEERLARYALTPVPTFWHSRDQWPGERRESTGARLHWQRASP
jgi:hypothetical protein